MIWLPKQREALTHLDWRNKECQLLLYGGAAGGGKSALGCAWQIHRRLKYAGTRGMIGRSQLDTLRKTTLRTFFEIAAMEGLIADKHYTYNGQTNIISFFNGSEILLKDLFAYPKDPNFDSLGSLEITDFFIDEVSQVTKKAVDIVRSRVRFKLKEYSLTPKGLMTCNPSKGWLYNEFYAPFKNEQLPTRFAFVAALPGDNPHLPDSYIDTLRSLPEFDRKRLLDGDWDYDESIDILFQSEDLYRCFRDEDLAGELFITADIARLGKDRTVIGLWKGLRLIGITELRRARVNEVVQSIRELASNRGVKLSNIIADEDGVGGGVVDSLKCRGFLNGSRAPHPERFRHLKAECYFKLAEFVEYGRLVLPSSHQEVICKELDMIRRVRPEADGKLSVTSKEEIARLHGISPDYADMIAMRMYFELFPNYGKYQFG